MIKRKAHGPAIRAIREALGLTQTRLAGAANIDRAYLANIELGYKQPSDEVSAAIALGLGVSRDAFTYGVEVQEAAA